MPGGDGAPPCPEPGRSLGMQRCSALQDLLPNPHHGGVAPAPGRSGPWEQSPRVVAATSCQWEMSPPNPPGTGGRALTLILISGFWM